MDTSIPVLVVDDSRTMSLIVSNALQKLGFADVDVAADGQSALELLRRKRHGLVLSDWEMQPMGGEQFIKEIRQDGAIARTPVVLITGKSSRGTSWLVGANAFLPKPFTDRDFEIAIKRALDKS